jgi:class 3 adenylate cyclase
VFLVGTDPVEVAAASLDCIAGLAGDWGLTSRAGLAFGTVVHRAGDVFGLTVNLSHILTKQADPASLLSAAVEPALLPAELCRHPRQVHVRGLDAPVRAYALTALD